MGLLLLAPALPELISLRGGPSSAFNAVLPLRLLAYLSGRGTSGPAFLLAALGLAGLAVLLRHRRLEAVYAGMLFALPLGAVWLVRPEFVRLRFFIFLVPWFVLGLAAAGERGWAVLRKPGRWILATRVVAIGILGASVWWWGQQVWGNVPNGGWRDASLALGAPAAQAGEQGSCAIGYGTRFYAWYTNAPVLVPRSLEEFTAFRERYETVRCAWRKSGMEDPAYAVVGEYLETHCGTPEQFQEIDMFTCSGRRR